MDDNILYSKVIDEDLEKGFQVRLCINVFKDVTYFQLRKYFLTYEGDWQASREGISIPANIENIYNLLDGLFEICAEAECIEVLEKYNVLVKNSLDPKPQE